MEEFLEILDANKLAICFLFLNNLPFSRNWTIEEESLLPFILRIVCQTFWHCFWVDVFKHYTCVSHKYVPVSFNDVAAKPLHYNTNICLDRTVTYIRNYIENGIVSVGHLLGQKGYFSDDQFKVRYPGAIVNIMLYEGTVRSVKHNQVKLELELEENVHNSEACVWKCMSGGCAKHIYVYLVKTDVSLRCIQNWSHALNMHIGTRTVFRHIIKTTQDTHLRCFQFRLIYRILPSQRFWFLIKIVNSATCTLCEVDEGTLQHMFWDCIKTQVRKNTVAGGFKSSECGAHSISHLLLMSRSPNRCFCHNRVLLEVWGMAPSCWNHCSSPVMPLCRPNAAQNFLSTTR